jgi:hypothetical protein
LEAKEGFVNITLTKLKINRALSEETDCFSATIMVNGVAVGDVVNRGGGGSHEYHWNKPEVGRDIEAWAAQQSTEFDFEKLDQVIDDLRLNLEVEKQLRRWMKTQTCFRLHGDKLGTWRTLKSTDPRAITAIREKYGDEVAFILTPDNLTEAIAMERRKAEQS